LVTTPPPISDAEEHPTNLPQATARLWRWLCDDALPLWWTVGADHVNGGFHEAIGQDGRPALLPRRGRVLPRQIYSFATAARLGWDGPAAAAVDHGLSFFLARFRRDDGLFRTCVEIDGRVRDDHAVLYDQAFALLGLYGAYRLEPRQTVHDAAVALLARIRQHFKHAGAGFREDDDHPFQSNAQMHTFEACIAWGGVAGGAFADTADELASLCMARLIDAELGAIDEFYNEAWAPDGAGGMRRIEPGHQFEWAWLLAQWGLARGQDVHRQVARLFQIGETAVSPGAKVAPAAIGTDGRTTDGLARLWPQTERLRTAAHLASRAGADRQAYERSAVEAANALLAYLDTPIKGLWRDKLTTEGAFVEEPAPASSLYHLVGAIAALKDMTTDAAAIPA
jgi:mannose-6-phosphate isomerase